MSNKEIFLKSFADLLHSYDKFIKYAAHNYCYCSEKKKKMNIMIIIMNI